MDDGRILILSDTHLGRGRLAALSAEALRPLWREADHVVINGDVAEVHHRKRWSEAARQTLHLLDLCDADGVTLTLLSGNHDPYISDARHLLLAGGQVLVTHGDVLHPAVSPWSPAAGRIRRAREQAMAVLAPERRSHLESILSASQFAAHAEWAQLEEEASHSSVPRMLIRPWAIVQVLHYWHVFPRLAAAFMEKHTPQARIAVLGHTHHEGIWTIRGRTIINTGAYGFPGRPQAVTIEGDVLRAWSIERKKGAYRLAAQPRARFELDAHTATGANGTAAKQRAAG